MSIPMLSPVPGTVLAARHIYTPPLLRCTDGNTIRVSITTVPSAIVVSSMSTSVSIVAVELLLWTTDQVMFGVGNPMARQ